MLNILNINKEICVISVICVLQF